MLEEYQNGVLWIDFFNGKNMFVLHVISRKINHRWVHFPLSCSKQEITEGVNILKQIYITRVFCIVAFHGNNEFEKVRYEMLPAILHIMALGEHIPEVKRSIRLIKKVADQESMGYHTHIFHNA